MSRTFRPILDATAGVVLQMIAVHQGRPCPTVAEIMEWTGLPRRGVAPFLARLVVRRIIEIEVRGRRPGRRRMRAVGGSWTGWTMRGGPR
ncbi:MAG: hypothetical protein ACHQK9_14360 [Reyranellales bacterium]